MRRFFARGIVGAVLTAIMAGSLTVVATPAFGFVTSDGPPTIDGSPAPQSGPTAGGQPVRIYGSGFDGTTSVKFGGVNATSFHIVDSHLITAVTPTATVSANTSVDITVTDADGTATGTNNNDTTGYFYTNASMSVSPNSGLAPGNRVIVSVSNYRPATGVVIPEFNPLLLYVEQAPDFPPTGPPPYAHVLASATTDSSGNLTTPSKGNGVVDIANPFDPINNDPTYDSNIQCPVNSTTRAFLGASSPSGSTPAYSARCMLAVGWFGKATLEAPITFSSGEPAATTPVLNLDRTSASRGDTVNIATGSTKWNGNPFFGSSSTPSNPGETNVSIKICWGTNYSTCSSTAGTGTVDMTRYINLVFSGAELEGSILVGSDVPSGPAVVKVTQYGPGGSQSISQTKALTIN